MVKQGAGRTGSRPTRAASKPTLIPQSRIRISDVRVQDFRVLRDVWVPLAETTLIVGPNNSGKTAFIDALAVALGERDPDMDDFFIGADGARAERAVIDLRLVPATGEDFEDSVRDVFGEAVQVPGDDGLEFVVLRTEITLGEFEGTPTRRRQFVRGWAVSRAHAEELTQLPDPVRADHRGSILFHQLDARRDLVAEMRNRRSFWGRLTRNVAIDDGVARDLRRALAKLGTRIKGASKVLMQAEKDIRRSAGVLDAENVRIEPLPADLDDLTRGMDVLFEAHGSAALSIGRQGMGTRSMASLEIFRSFVNLRLARVEGPAPLPLTAFEEPEAHIHPQAHRAVFDVIRTVPGQKVVSTHSPFVASSAGLFDVRRFRRDGAVARCHWLEQRAAGGTPTFDEDDLEKLSRLAFDRHAEVLFARVVILFEGDTEQAALPVFARHHWDPTDPAALGISFFNYEGARNLEHALRLLHALRIPWLALADGDPAGSDGIEAAANAIGVTFDLDQPNCPVVMLSSEEGGVDFEHYVVASRPDLVEAGIEAEFGNDALALFQKKWQGQKRKGGSIRDYDGVDGSTELLVDFLAAKKVRGGRAFADAAVARNVVPAAINDLFKRADRLLGAKP